MTMAKLVIRATLRGHEKDVRAVVGAEFPRGSIVSGSRDITTRLWAQNETDSGFHEAHIMSGHSKYVASVCIIKSDEKYPHGLILTGSNDNSILAFTLDSPSPVFKLEGHTGAVCCLCSGNFGTLLSGSWDKTAKVWINQKNVMTLEGHDASVWAVLIMSEGGMMLTGSADKSIRLWKAGKCVRTLTGHTDCVRGLCALSGAEFLSCSNDATIRRWMLSGECLQTYDGHTSYIYAITAQPGTQRFFSCGEDRSLKMWDATSGLQQSVTLPAQSLWCLTCLSDGDVAVGCSDGTVRVFTCAPERAAAQEEQQALEAEVSSSSIPSQLGELNTEQLPGPEALLREGKREGQTLMVRRGTTIECHQWSGADQRWIKVGDVVGASGGQQASSGKQTYEGKEYDYVFDVDLDGQTPLKLPYNSGEDPWMAAQRFIHKHELSQLFLDQIANFITSQTGGVTLGMTGGNADPLTGGSSYHSGGGPGAEQSGSQAGVSDPLTGPSRYVPGQDASAAKPSSSKYFPHLSYLTFDAADIDKILAKLSEFNQLQPADQQLTQTAIAELRALASGASCAEAALSALQTVLTWPPEHCFPGLDVARLAVRHAPTSARMAAPLLPVLLQHVLRPSAAARLVACRALANLLASSSDTVLSSCDDVTDALISAADSPMAGSAQTALSTVLLNLSVAGAQNTLAQSVPGGCVRAAAALIPVLSEPEAQFRTLVALGNVLREETAQAAAASLQLRARVNAVVQRPEKVAACRADVLTLL